MNFEKEVNSYGLKREDFVIENELTVTITLNEYRNLIKEYAKSSATQEKLESEKYQLQKELSVLKAKIERLMFKDEKIEDEEYREG